MKQTNKDIIVQLANPERKFVKVYQDFLQNELLTSEEKIVFIVLKSFVDFSKDNSGTQGEAYPTMETICKLSSLSKPRATRAINKLIEKKIVKKIRRGLTKSNVYILSDYATMWACDNLEDLTTIAENEGTKPLTPEEHIKALEKMGYEVEIKEKEPTSEPTKVTDVSTQKKHCSQEQNTIPASKSQELEQYTSNQIKEFFNYDIMITDNPERKTDIDIAFDILYDTLNWTKSTIKIDGQEKPSMVVKSKLMKLEQSDLIYSIKKYHEQKDRIKNVNAYFLTILYHAKEQSYLDIMNLGHYNGDF